MLCTYSNVVEIDSLHLTFQVSILCSPDCWLNKGNFFGFEMKHVLYKYYMIWSRECCQQDQSRDNLAKVRVFLFVNSIIVVILKMISNFCHNCLMINRNMTLAVEFCWRQNFWQKKIVNSS